MIAVLAGAAAESRRARDADSRPLLDLDETAKLLGVSRMTVVRLADEGQIPSIVVRRGKVHKIRRIPRAFIEQMVSEAALGAQIDVADDAEAWLARHARRTDQ